MISLGGLVSQKAFGKFEMGKVISNPFANAFIKEGDGEDHEVSMGQNQLDTIIKMATELKAKMGEDEKQIPAWIQDHISKAENYISQAAGNYHEYGDSNENINEAPNDKQITSLEKEHQMLAAKGSAIMDKQRQLIRTTLGSKFEYPWENYDKWPTKLKIEVEKLNLQFEKNNVEVQKAFEKLMKAKGTWRTESIKEASPCWKGYKQVGMKDKGGRQVPNCVPNESVVNENILNEDLDALGLLIPALGAVIGGGLAQLYPYFTGRPNIYSNIKDWWNSKKDNSEMNKIANRIKNDPDVQEFLKKKNKSGWKEMLKKKLTGSELNYINKIYRSRFNSESVNEAPNTGEKIQNLNNRIKVLRDKISATKSPEQKKLHSDRLKNALQSLSNIRRNH